LENSGLRKKIRCGTFIVDEWDKNGDGWLTTLGDD